MKEVLIDVVFHMLDEQGGRLRKIRLRSLNFPHEFSHVKFLVAEFSLLQ